MSENIIEFSKHQKPRAATAQPKAANIPFTDAEFNELLGAMKPRTVEELCNEAMEQAYIEMNGGPIDMSKLPPVVTKPAVTADDVRHIKEMVQKTREHLEQYITAFRSLKSH